MRKLTAARTSTTSERLKGQGLGLVVLLLTLAAAWGVARMHVRPTAAVAPKPSIEEIKTHIDEAAARYGVPAKLVSAVISVESEFDPHAVSRRGAVGLMQLMPDTAESLDVRNAFEARDNIDGGVRHLKHLIARFDNDLPLAIAAYNAGEKAVVSHRGVPPYRETRQYVVRVLRRYDRQAARDAAQRLAAAGRPQRTPPRTSPRVSRVAHPLPAPAAAAVDTAAGVHPTAPHEYREEAP